MPTDRHRDEGALGRAPCLVGVALLLASCNTTAPAPESGPATPVIEAPAPQAAKIVVANVVWPELMDEGRAVIAALPKEAAARVAASKLPVFLPPTEAWLAGATVVTKATWTTASMRADGLTIVVTGSRAARVVPGVSPVKGNVPVRGALGFVTRNEGVWAVSWIENEVAYSVEIECDVGGDARCADEALAMGVARDLVFAGGDAAEGGAR